MSADFRAPKGKLILPVNAPRDQWLRTRLMGVGGTDIATLMGANRYQTIFDAWVDKTNPNPVEESSEAMWWGSKTEALTAERFEDETGLITKRAGTYANKTHPHHLVNPDRFTSDGGVLEVKDHEPLSEAGRTVLAGEVTEHAWCQLQWACHVTGRSHGWFAAKVGKKAVILGPFPRRDDVIARMVEKADWFWQLVQTDTPPPIDYNTVTADEVAARFPTVTPESSVAVEDLPLPEVVLDDLARLNELRATGEKYAMEREQIETRLKAVIGDREFLTVGGRPVLRWQPVAGRRTFDKAAAVKALAQAWGKTPTEVEAELTKQGAGSRRFSPMKESA